MNDKLISEDIGVLKFPKKVIVTQDFIGLSNTFLTLPFFVGSNYLLNDEEAISVSYSSADFDFKFYDYENISIKSRFLSLDFDFELVMFLVRKYVQSRSKTITFTFEELFSAENIKIDRRNFAKYVLRAKKTVEKLKDFEFSFSRANYDTRGFLKWVTEVELLDDDKGYTLHLGLGFIMFYESDKEIITNLDMSKFRLIKTDYGRILYMLYIAKNANYCNVFSTEALHFRLHSLHANKAEINRGIKKAHTELLSLNLLLQAKEIKKGNKIIQFNIVLNKNLTKKAKKVSEKILAVEKPTEVVEPKRFSIFDKSKSI